MKIAVLHAKLAPYHVARLEAAGAHARARGGELVAVEVAPTQRDYRWARTDGEHAHFRRITLFPDEEYWQVGYRRMRERVVAALDRERPDVVTLPGWGFRESLAALGWAARNAVPRVLVSDSQPIDTGRRAWKESAKRAIVRSFQSAFVGGAPHARYARELGIDPSRIVPGCDVVDNAAYAPAASQRSWDGPPRLVSILRLLPRKNIEGVLDALAATPSWGWELVGDGPERAKVERMVRERGLAERVRLLGHLPDEALVDALARAHVYVQPSLSEPWGLAVNEAMAAGLPILVSDRCGCHEDLVRPGVNGHTFDPRDPSALPRALATMLTERGQWPAMGEASAKIVAGWGLDLYARNLWRACELARDAPARRDGLARWL